MKVKQLIKKLQAFNPDAEVYVIPSNKQEKATNGAYTRVVDAEQKYSNIVLLGTMDIIK